MKTVFDGMVKITISEIDGEFIATGEYKEIPGTDAIVISSSKVNREYAAIGEVFATLKKTAIDKAETPK
jgi:hypothetical protein